MSLHVSMVDSILLLNSILLYDKPQFLSHLSFDGHLNYFQIWGIKNKVVMSIWVQGFYGHMLSIILCRYLEQCLSSMENVYLTFYETVKLFLKW